MKRIFMLCLLVSACRTESSNKSEAQPVVSASASVAEVPTEAPSGRGHGRHPEMRLVRPAPPQVTGNLPAPVIQRIMRSRLAQIRTCYETALAKEPALAGTVTVHLVIDAKGAVTKSERDPSTTITSADVVTCTVDAIKSLPFPVPEGGGTVDVIQAFAFQPPTAAPPPQP